MSISKDEVLHDLWMEENPIKKYNLIKYAFLSVMTKTELHLQAITSNKYGHVHIRERKEMLRELEKLNKMESTNKQKEKSLLFQYRNRKWNPFSNELIQEIFSYLKPKPL